MPLLKILTDPQNFKFYAGGKGYVSTPDSFGQKSIPYGKDQYGGGWSKQPFVTKPITVNGSDVQNTGGPDFLVRGGSLIPGKVADDTFVLGSIFSNSEIGGFFSCFTEAALLLPSLTNFTGDISTLQR